jgi:sugar/nucleoside kinase (ribokinase family)
VIVEGGGGITMDIFSIGEMLIDFIPGSEPNSYLRNAGGAPANVAIAAARNGLSAGFCGKMGNDNFGRFLLETLEENKVKALCPNLTDDAITTMTFVTLRENGERSFTFARKPGADMLLFKSDINVDDIVNSSIIHAGSCSLSAEPAAGTLMYVFETAGAANKMISFDINYRDLLWNKNKDAAAAALTKVYPYVDLLKISEEEIDMIVDRLDKAITAVEKRNNLI